ncbi:rab-related protein 4 [Grosmannia clavigera kw1407]|uniref:Rab-related protein 4 n=1 Tax=Grosmannia clavigera (strain kw1407 / UAMH 11150) TaxID=655863 RepID=F0XP89_GROCL|nr:rab-related protein 4 [Grosmannia clavigera kw1407]EFX00595.1 rab-related protein 4 [Grosmannia clavigera kw1407]
MENSAIKILIMGSSNVGKTSLLQCYLDPEFGLGNPASTIGTVYNSRHMRVRGMTYRVDLIDTAGQERFRALPMHFYRGAHGIIFVYDLAKRKTFDELEGWVAQAETNIVPGAGDSGIACQYGFVGNKLDRATALRAVSTVEGTELARRLGQGHGSDGDRALYFETSAMLGQNVSEPFGALVDSIVALLQAASVVAVHRPRTTVRLNRNLIAAGWDNGPNRGQSSTSRCC